MTGSDPNAPIPPPPKVWSPDSKTPPPPGYGQAAPHQEQPGATAEQAPADYSERGLHNVKRNAKRMVESKPGFIQRATENSMTFGIAGMIRDLQGGGPTPTERTGNQGRPVQQRTVEAARNGDTTAQQALDERGISWRQ